MATEKEIAERLGVTKTELDKMTIGKDSKGKPQDCWGLVEKVLPKSRRVLLYGPPGTGKTWAGTHASKKVYNITITEDMSPSQLWGHFIFEGQNTKWHNGVASLAWLEGACLVINEIDAACGAVEVALHAILDDPEFAKMTLDNGTTIKPIPGFCAVATMNGVPSDLPDALRDRFPVKISIDKPCEQAINALPKAYQKACKKAYSRSGGPMTLTYRAIYEFCQLVKSGVEEIPAAQAIWGETSYQDTLTQLKLSS
jgi:MoxR-like ATPase